MKKNYSTNQICTHGIAISILLLFGFISPQSWADGDQVSTFRAYGFLMPTFSGADGATDSFGNQNQAAPTAAHNPTQPSDNLSRTTFQVAQSRIGLQIGSGPSSNIKGQLEIDFFDATKASPTVAALPRLRIAKIEYLPTETTTLFFGQDWDLFSPLNPFTYNVIGSYFNAGNAGFMRQQFGVIQKISNFEAAGAIGLAGSNSATTETNLELSKVPTLSARLAYLRDKSRFGVSGIWTRILFNSAQDLSTAAFGFNVFVEYKPCEPFQFRAEAYGGENLGNIGALTLGVGRVGTSVSEAGGYLSTKIAITQGFGVFGGFGYAKAVDEERVSIPSTSATGLTSNRTVRLGIDQRLSEKLVVFAEGSQFRSHYRTYGATTVGLVSLGMQLSL